MKGLLNIFVLLQKLVPSTKHFIRVKIVYSFKRNPDPGLTYLQKEPGNQFLLRSIYSTRDEPNIASFTLNKHLLLVSPIHYSKTRMAFIPIIPYSATDFNTIYTCIQIFRMIFYKKTLSQANCVMKASIAFQNLKKLLIYQDCQKCLYI